MRPEAQQVVIVAAYRVLAAFYHPDRDGSAAWTRRMAELNDAYAKVRTADRRAVYDKARQLRSSAPGAVVTPHSAPAADGVSSVSLDFGRYTGWTVSQIAKQDLD